MPPDALAKGAALLQSFERPLSGDLLAIDKWRLLAEAVSKLISLAA